MKTLKIVMLMILFSLFMTSCTDLINSDDQVILDSIEKVDSTTKATGGSDGSGSGDGKGGEGNG
jgi:hypothetical protein